VIENGDLLLRRSKTAVMLDRLRMLILILNYALVSRASSFVAVMRGPRILPKGGGTGVFHFFSSGGRNCYFPKAALLRSLDAPDGTRSLPELDRFALSVGCGPCGLYGEPLRRAAVTREYPNFLRRP